MKNQPKYYVGGVEGDTFDFVADSVIQDLDDAMPAFIRRYFMSQWSTERPSKRGWYFAYEALPDENAEVVCVWFNGKYAYTMDVKFDPDDFSAWIPIVMPNPSWLKDATVDRSSEDVEMMEYVMSGGGGKQ